MKRDDRVNVRLGFQTKTDLEKIAEALEIPVSELVREAIRNIIKENQDKL